MTLEDHLKFQRVSQPLQGDTPLDTATRPTRSGLKLLAVPTACVGLAFRVCNTVLEAVSISHDAPPTSMFSVSLGPAPAVNIAASADGRLVAVCLADGSLECYNATAGLLELRWRVEGAHSHVSADLNQSASTSRENAAGAAGPARSLQFSPQGYALALVDDGQQGLTIYHAECNGTPIESVQTQLSHLSLACAAWSPFVADDNECLIALGTVAGNGVHVYKYNTQTSRLDALTQLAYPGDEDQEQWSCTHLEWIQQGTAIAAGYCRVISGEDVGDDDDEEEEEDDSAEHEACLYISNFPPDGEEPLALGDVVPFFSVPRHGRHVFFTAVLPTKPESNTQILLVASNVGSDVSVLCREGTQPWESIDIPEGDNVTTPTDDEDEYMFPVGLAVAMVSENGAQKPVLLLPITDGNLTSFDIAYGGDETYFLFPGLPGTTVLPAEPVPGSNVVADAAPPALAEEPPAVPEVAEPAPAPPPVSTFGSEFFGGGEGFSLGISTPDAASGSGEAAQAPSSTAPLFGSGAPAFGSGSSNLAFGSGSSLPTFGSVASTGFAPLAKTPATSFGQGGAESSSAFGLKQPSDPFNVFTKKVTMSPEQLAKPLFGAPATSDDGDKAQSKEKTSTVDKPAATKDTSASSAYPPIAAQAPKPFGATASKSSASASSAYPPIAAQAPKLFSAAGTVEKPVSKAAAPSPKVKESPPSQSPAAKRAGEVFDDFDNGRKGWLPTSAMEDLLDGLGEGFYGEELEAQVALIDKKKTGKLERAAFIDWYVQLSDGQSDADSSLDTDEREELQEEKEKAEKHFKQLGQQQGDSYTISTSDFPKLLEALGSTYCDEEHKRTVKKLQSSDGRISLEKFTRWYIDWLFGGDEDSIESDDGSAEEVNKAAGPASKPIDGPGWGNIFQQDKGTWKCDVCTAPNKGADNKCAACETPRPGATVSTGGVGSTAAAGATSSISKKGFSFGGGGSSSIGPSGFSFGGVSGGKPASGTSAGFQFGSSLPSAGGAGGFSFGGTPAATTESKVTSKKIPEQEPAGSKSSAPASSAFPPIAAQAPKLFSTAGTAEKTTSSTAAAPSPSSLSPARRAAEVFDDFDKDSNGWLPTSSMEDLLDGLGEGFHGEELDEQVALIDKKKTGKLERAAFVDWYVQLSDGQTNADSSLDTGEREERQEEKEKAEKHFKEIGQLRADSYSISTSDFPKLLEALGSTYCEEEHKRTVKKLQSSDERISLDKFTSWYIDWLFGGDEDSIESDDGSAGQGISAGPASKPIDGPGWGNIFRQDKGTWKCEVCTAPNKGADNKCAACETPRPGATVSTGGAQSTSAAAGATSSIGAKGFSLGGGGSSSIGSSGFSFGGVSGGGKPTTTGFQFGSSVSSTGGASGFSFGGTPAATAESKDTSKKMPEIQPSEGKDASAAASKSSAPASSAYPPIAAQAPKPFGGAVAASKSSGSSSSAYPPISVQAPKVFGGATASSKSSTPLSSAYPPMSGQAPKPFGGAVASTKSSGSSSSAYPPMSGQAPKPFGGAVASSKSSAPSSSGYPPMSGQAPKPFGGGAAASKSSGSSSSAYPPMSGQAPKPFGGAVASSTGSAPASSAYPPIAAQAPKPFGGGGAASSKSSGSSGSAYPPISAQAPKVFGGATASTRSSAPSSSAYPPMSGQAPTPFGGGGAASSKSSGSISSIFRPKSGQAPKPFVGATASTKSSAPLSSAYPPMSGQAPKPFGGGGATSSETSASASSTYPPMSGQAPKPFGGSVASSKGSAPPSSAYPPMSGQAPKPFGGGGAASSKGSGSSSSAYPPLSGQAPTPFGGAVTKSSAGTKVSASPFSSTPAKSSAPPKMPSTRSPPAAFPAGKGRATTSEGTGVGRINDVALTESSRQFVNLSQMMEKTLATMHRQLPRQDDDNTRKEIDGLLGEIRILMESLTGSASAVSEHKSRCVKVLSGKAQASRKIVECENLTSKMLSPDGRNESEAFASQPLDADSEGRRREMIARAMMSNRLLEIVQARLELLGSLGDPDADKLLLYTVHSMYKSIKAFDNEEVSRIEQRARKLLDQGTTQSSPASRSRIPIVPKATDMDSRKKQILKMWQNVEGTVEGIPVPGTKKIDAIRAEVTSPQNKKSERPVRSPLMRGGSSTAGRAVPAGPFSPSLETRPRSGWSEMSSADQTRMKRLSFSTPTDLKETTLNVASREALTGYGTTQEKVKESLRIQKQGGSTSAKPRAPVPSKAEAPSLTPKASLPVRSSMSPSFPPLSSKAPTPVSEKLKVPTSSAGPPAAPTTTAAATKSASDSAPKLAVSKTPEPVTKSPLKSMGGGLGNLGGLGAALFSGGNMPAGEAQPGKAGFPSSTGTTNATATAAPDYYKLLHDIYSRHNTAKVGEVQLLLDRYKGREPEMFAKLSKKYKIPNPLEEAKGSSSALAGNGKTAQSPFSATGSGGIGQPPPPATSQKPPLSSSAFPSTPGPSAGTTPFGTPAPANLAGGPSPTLSPFGGAATTAPTTTPFGGSKPSSSPSPFSGGPNTFSTMPSPVSSPFGSGQQAPTPTPGFAPAAPPPAVGALAGKSPRDMLTAFYQTYNQTKVAQVDGILKKYMGREEELFRNLAKKYHLDPATFGLPPATSFGSPPAPSSIGVSSPGFGQPSVLGGGSTFGGATSPSPRFGAGSTPGGAFGQASALGRGFGSPGPSTAPTGSVFGSGGGASQFGASGFGTLAQSPAPSGFGAMGSPPQAPFGTSTPFGAPRR